MPSIYASKKFEKAIQFVDWSVKVLNLYMHKLFQIYTMSKAIMQVQKKTLCFTYQSLSKCP